MSNYNAEDIEVLTGLDPVKKRPGMYTDTSRPNHLAQEVIDNSVDEALAGHARRVDVTLHKDGSLSVCDDGRGMPVDIHPEQGLPGVEVILSTLHAGGKFSNNNYQFSGGLHGVGVSCVNALSEHLKATVFRDGKVYEQEYERGKAMYPVKNTGDTDKRGTTVTFKPDSTIIFAAEICGQITGIPNQGSLEPQRPGPIKIYFLSFATNFLLISSTAIAISLVLAELKVSGFT